MANAVTSDSSRRRSKREIKSQHGNSICQFVCRKSYRIDVIRRVADQADEVNSPSYLYGHTRLPAMVLRPMVHGFQEVYVAGHFVGYSPGASPRQDCKHKHSRADKKEKTRLTKRPGHIEGRREDPHLTDARYVIRVSSPMQHTKPDAASKVAVADSGMVTDGTGRYSQTPGASPPPLAGAELEPTIRPSSQNQYYHGE
jgi:hypothetical protein